MMGKKKARFLRAWRQKKTDSDLRTSVKGYSVTLALNHALDMANYIKTEDVSNNENRKLVKKLGDCASYLVFKHYYTENKVILHGMKPAASSYCVRSVRFVGLLSMCERIGTRLPL